LTLNYGLTRRLSGNLALFYVSGGTKAAALHHLLGTTIDISPSLRYLITRRLSANAVYHHTSDLAPPHKTITFAGLSFSF